MIHHYKAASFILFLTVVLSLETIAQTYAPPVGVTGTTAMYKDSSAFVDWVIGCKLKRGYQDISNPSLGFASVGDSTSALGIPDIGVASLGDGGSAICTFGYPVTNGAGPDFAVFENGFDNTFLELAFVEVSSDGVNFFRFPSHSLTDTVSQTTSFGSTDATKINNLAGKYKGEYGTPFDLQELANNPGLNINAITHIKITDVIGTLNNAYATRDSYHNKVNDPWPTAYPSGGFDLDAIGVIHESRIVGIKENNFQAMVRVYPNPVTASEKIKIIAPFEIDSVEIIDFAGNSIRKSTGKDIETAQLSTGIYLLKLISAGQILIKKIQIQ